jgi:hypothetical protein
MEQFAWAEREHCGMALPGNQVQARLLRSARGGGWFWAEWA